MLDRKNDASWVETHRQSFSISYNYPVYFTRDLFDPANPCLQGALSAVEPDKRHRFALFVDEGVTLAAPNLLPRIARHAAAHAAGMQLAGDIVVVPGGEGVKNQHSYVEHVLKDLSARNIDRQSFAIAIGGGAVLDAVGFAAAIFHRGVRHIRCPTTVLAQDDSGVGVKNGMNAFGKKNFIGTFAVPWAVVNDFDLLASLSARDKRAGYIEAVKVACIRDAVFFEELERDAARLREFEPEAMQRLIVRCAELHVNHIATSGDPFELGSARPLDFGHWAAHKLEQISEYKLRHGEAVAIGIALDVIYSRRMGFLPAASAERVLSLIEALGFDLFANELLHADSAGALVVLKGLEEFSEHLGGRLTITLLHEIGQGFEVHEMNSATVLESIRELETRHKQRVESGVVPLFQAGAR
jgi:3-dehydroquinate synthase